MKTNLKNLIGYTLGASDGEIGKITDFYLDDQSWTIRYLVVETGTWLFGRKVLISPEALMKREWDAELLPVNLSKAQVKSSPEINTDLPVSRRHEIDLHGHYAWDNYWGTGFYGVGRYGLVQAKIDSQNPANKQHPDPKDEVHLRSLNHVAGYKIVATDGEIGDAHDFIVDDSTWKIEYLIVDTGTWLPGKKVILPPAWIYSIKWESFSIEIKVSVNSIKNCPEYDHSVPLSETYETELKNFYSKHGKDNG